MPYQHVKLLSLRNSNYLRERGDSMFNDECCIPPTPRKEERCCKDGIICALDYFYQDFLSTTQTIEAGSLSYYPKLEDVSNIIYNIPYITPDIVPVYITEITNLKDSYCGDITNLNICGIEGFQFQFTENVVKTIKEADITTRFSRVRYVSPKNCCCKNGLIEHLLKARDFLINPDICNGQTLTGSVILSTVTNSFTVSGILAINTDTVWAKYDVPNSSPQQTIYYVISLCKLLGITFHKNLVSP